MTTINNLTIEQMRKEVLEMGFKELQHFTITNPLVYDLGRRRVLSLGCLGQGNEVIYLCEKSKVGDHYEDLVCVHNADYDGFITIQRLKALIDWFEAGKEAERHG